MFEFVKFQQKLELKNPDLVQEMLSDLKQAVTKEFNKIDKEKKIELMSIYAGVG